MFRKTNCRFSRTLFSSSRASYCSFPKRCQQTKHLRQFFTQFLSQPWTKRPFFSSPSEREHHAPLLPRILELARYRTSALMVLTISKGKKPPFTHFWPFRHCPTPRQKNCATNLTETWTSDLNRIDENGWIGNLQNFHKTSHAIFTRKTAKTKLLSSTTNA